MAWVFGESNQGALFDLNSQRFLYFNSGDSLVRHLLILTNYFILIYALQINDEEIINFGGVIFDYNAKYLGYYIKHYKIEQYNIYSLSLVSHRNIFIWSIVKEKDNNIFGKLYLEECVCEDFWQEVTINMKKSRVEFPDNEYIDLQVVLIELPSCGRMLDANGSELKLDNGYQIRDIFYQPCLRVGTQDVVKYIYTSPSVNYQTDQCQITLVIVPAQHCFKALKLIMRSSGDISTITEDMEMEFTYFSGKKLDCGLFKFDINNRNGDTKVLNISMPCIDGEYVDIRFIERDNCNDDSNLYSFKCEIQRLPRNKIEINPDNTVYTKSYCEGYSHSTSSCLEGTIPVGGSFCNDYSWEHEKCSGRDVSEKTSLYYFGYQVTDEPCEVDFSKLKNRETCYHHHYQPGPQCNSILENAEQYYLEYSIIALFNIMMLLF